LALRYVGLLEFAVKPVNQVRRCPYVRIGKMGQERLVPGITVLEAVKLYNFGRSKLSSYLTDELSRIYLQVVSITVLTVVIAPSRSVKRRSNAFSQCSAI
jgi:hypothetical protein